MLSCKDESRGFFTYECESCGTQKTVYFGCNSRICTNCGKNHTDKWAKSLKNALFNVPHRHAVLTITDVLWPIVRGNRFLHKVLMDAAIAAINDTISYPNTKFTLTSISPTKEDRRIKPNQKCQLKIEKSNYILEYSADFCDGHFEVDGMGTISPTYYKLELKVTDVSNDREQIIWQIPHEHFYRLHDIEIGDINNDKKQDMVNKLLIYFKNNNNT